jgi:hypothetical protein
MNDATLAITLRSPLGSFHATPERPVSGIPIEPCARAIQGPVARFGARPRALPARRDVDGCVQIGTDEEVAVRARTA